MEKFKLRVKNYSFDHEGMIIRGEYTGINDGYIKCNARTLCEDNIDIMSERDILDAMAFGAHNTWNYYMGRLQSLKVNLTHLEYELLKHCSKRGFKYIARDKDRSLYVYKNDPDKNDSYWDVEERIIDGTNNFYSLNLFIDEFPFINWTDEEPRSIKEMLENCEVIEDE